MKKILVVIGSMGFFSGCSSIALESTGTHGHAGGYHSCSPAYHNHIRIKGAKILHTPTIQMTSSHPLNHK